MSAVHSRGSPTVSLRASTLLVTEVLTEFFFYR